MGKKNKNKKKEINPKKVKYAKFRKDKPAQMDLSMPELAEDFVKERRVDETRIEKHFKFSRNPNTRSVNPRKDESKR